MLYHPRPLTVMLTPASGLRSEAVTVPSSRLLTPAGSESGSVEVGEAVVLDLPPRQPLVMSSRQMGRTYQARILGLPSTATCYLAIVWPARMLAKLCGP